MFAILATCWHEVPMPPLEGEVPNEREAEGFVRKLSKKTPQSARSGCQLPFQGSQGGFAARVARLATPTRAYRLKVCTTWLPPGGSCQTALRNRLTDEGRRTVGQDMQLDERRIFQIVPFNREIQNF